MRGPHRGRTPASCRPVPSALCPRRETFSRRSSRGRASSSISILGARVWSCPWVSRANPSSCFRSVTTCPCPSPIWRPTSMACRARCRSTACPSSARCRGRPFSRWSAPITAGWCGRRTFRPRSPRRWPPRPLHAPRPRPSRRLSPPSRLPSRSARARRRASKAKPIRPPRSRPPRSRSSARARRRTRLPRHRSLPHRRPRRRRWPHRPPCSSSRASPSPVVASRAASFPRTCASSS